METTDSHNKTKLAQTLGIIFKAKYYTSPIVLKQIYYSFFSLNYAISYGKMLLPLC